MSTTTSGGSGGAAGGAAGLGGSSGAGAGGTSSSKFGCASPQPVVVDGKDTGVELCADGSIHKKTAGECPVGAPSQTACASSSGGSCKFASDCTEKPNGYCLHMIGFGGDTCACSYGCTKDSECGPGRTCLCGDPIGTCVKATCTEDVNCGPGNLCTSFDESKGCGMTMLACRRAGDACGGDKDCASPPGPYCVPDADGVRHCEPGGCAVGRPLFVEARIVVAAATSWSAWA